MELGRPAAMQAGIGGGLHQRLYHRRIEEQCLFLIQRLRFNAMDGDALEVASTGASIAPAVKRCRSSNGKKNGICAV